MSPNIILVAGATGQQGGAVVKRLVQLQSNPVAGAEPIVVCALSRDPQSASAQRLVSQGVTVAKGELTDESSLTHVMTSNSVSSAFLVTSPFGKSGFDGEIQQGKTFIKAAQAAGVKHIVFSSVDGSERKSGVLHWDSKFEIEKTLRASGIPYTIFRTVAFMENFPLDGIGRFFGLGIFHAALQGRKIQMISVRDIGYFAAEALTKPNDYEGKVVGIAGDELTAGEITATFGKAQGKSAWSAWLPGGVIYLLPADMKRMFLWFRSDGYTVDIPAARARHPGLLSFEDYLKWRMNKAD